MWQWITYLPVKSLKCPATRIVSPGETKKVSFRQSSQGGGGLPLRASMYQSVWCMCMMCVTAVRLVICQVSVVFRTGKACERAGLKVLPLISQLAEKPPPSVITQLRSGACLAAAAQAGSGRSEVGTEVVSGVAGGAPTRNCISGPT